MRTLYLHASLGLQVFSEGEELTVTDPVLPSKLKLKVRVVTGPALTKAGHLTVYLPDCWILEFSFRINM